MVPGALVSRNIEVDGTVGSRVGEALAHEFLDETDVLGDELGDTGDGGRGEDVERAHVFAKMALPIGRKLGEYFLRVGSVLVERVEVGEENRGGGGVERFGGRSVASEGSGGRE